MNARPQQPLRTTNSSNGFSKMSVQFRCIPMRAVRQVVFSLGPDKLGWVEFRSIGRKSVNSESCMTLNELGNDLVSVNRASVPKQNHGSGQMSQKVAQKEDDFNSGDVVSMILQIKSQALSLGRDTESADGRDAITLLTVSQNGGLPARSPCATNVGNEQESAFVEKNQMGPKFFGVFLYPAMYCASSKQWPPRPVEGRDVPVFDNSIPDLPPKASESHPNHTESHNAFRSGERSALPSTSRWSSLPAWVPPKVISSISPSAHLSVDKVVPESAWNAVHASPSGDIADTNESPSSRMPSVSGRQSGKSFHLEAKKLHSVVAFPIVGKCRKVSFQNTYHISFNVSIT